MNMEQLQIEKNNAKPVATINEGLPGVEVTLQIEVSKSDSGLVFLDFKKVYQQAVVAYLLVLHLRAETAREFGGLMLDHLKLSDAERADAGIGSFNVSEFTGIDIEFEKGDERGKRPDLYVLKYPVADRYENFSILPEALRQLGESLSKI